MRLGKWGGIRLEDLLCLLRCTGNEEPVRNLVMGVTQIGR